MNASTILLNPLLTLEILCVFAILMTMFMRSIFVKPILEVLDIYYRNKSGLTFYLSRRRIYSGYFEISEWQETSEELTTQEELWNYSVSAMKKIEKIGHYEIAWFFMDEDERKMLKDFLSAFATNYNDFTQARSKMQAFYT